ncbi:MAG: TonB-dependent receptor [Bacteroidales bacterium]|nr:TonB-dependent receptor [Bacteroidales bacterium]HOY39846.1 TonB-dependent receptor [Bacteroidales bacterium]HQP03226.1 TonB-dependent receptor [Bacteroidales bacterium]
MFVPLNLFAINVNRIYIALLCLLFGFTVKAQDVYLDDSITMLPNVNILAERPVYEHGLKISHIDSLIYEENRQYSMSELIAWKTPVFIKSYGRGSMATASFRGTDPSHTQVTWNGVPLNSPLLGMADFSQIPLIIADGIDLYHGTASLLSGYPAIGGRISMTGSPVWNKGFELDVISAAGSFHTFDESLQAGYSSKKLSAKAGMWYSYSRNDFGFQNRDVLDGVYQVRENASWKRYGLIADSYFRLRENSVLSVKLWGQSGSRYIPQLSTNESGYQNNLNRQTDELLNGIISFSSYNNNSRLTVQSAVSMQDCHYTLENYISGTGFLSAVSSVSTVFSSYNFADYKVNFSKKWFASALIQFDFHAVESKEDISVQQYNVRRGEGAASVAVSYKPVENLTVGVSLRQQLTGNRFLPLMPSLQLEFNPIGSLILKSNISRVFRSPSLNDLYFQPGGNPFLLPEESVLTETGIQWSYAHNKVQLQTEITGYYSDIRNWIMWKPTLRGYWTPENVAKVQSYGIEASLKTEIQVHSFTVSLNSGYTLSHSVNKTVPENAGDLSYGCQLPYIPVHSAMLYGGVSYKGFTFGYQWNYYSERLTSTAGESSPLISLYPYFMNDVSLGKHFDMNAYSINLRFSVMNLFNESYRSVLWQPMPGRNYMLTLRFMLK